MSKLPFNTDIDFTDIQEILPSNIGVRKKLYIYKATNQHNDIYCILYINQKSRVLQKEVDIYEDIYSKIKEFTSAKFNKKHIYIQAPLCSKAKEKLGLHDWEVTHII